MRNWKGGFGLLAAVVLLPVLFAGAKWLASFDPFARFSGDYANPFGRNIGSYMENVSVSVLSGKGKVASFDAKRLLIRRDKQFMQLELISNGAIYDKGKKAADFKAALASYDARQELIQIAGGADVSSKEFTFTTPALAINKKRSTLFADSGITGKYRSGDIQAKTLLMDFDGGRTVATEVSWKGPVEVQQKNTRNVQFRARKFEQFTNPDRTVYTDAEATDQDAMMRAKTITYDHENEVITMEGDCEYFGPDAIISAPKVVVYRSQKKVLASGAVRMFVKPEKQKGVLSAEPLPPAEPVLPPGLKQPPAAASQQQEDIERELRSGKNARKYPVVVTCTKLEYTYAKGNKKAVLTGSPKARQEMRAGSWREIAAPTVIYEEEKELLTLLSGAGGRDVKMTNSAGDHYTAEQIVISTTEGNERLSGTRIEGVMKVRDEGGG